jgi:hypothetical protein
MMTETEAATAAATAAETAAAGAAAAGAETAVDEAAAAAVDVAAEASRLGACQLVFVRATDHHDHDDRPGPSRAAFYVLSRRS